MKKETQEFLKKIPKEIYYTLAVFFITRVALTAIGATSLEYFSRQNYSPSKILNTWGLWDTGWYIEIASTGYSAAKNLNGWANYGFFPLYPILIKIFSFITQNYFIAALLVSNLFLILAAVFLYKLARLDCDEKTSLRAIKYLFVFPSAFILSAALSESLFLFLLLACMYYAKKKKWLLSGVSGMLLTLTKPFGIIILLPVIYEYVKNFLAEKAKGEINILKILKDGFSVALIPLGLALFTAYTWLLTGDIFAYPHIKQIGWHNYLENPIRGLYENLLSRDPGSVWGAVASIIIIFLLVIFYKKIGFSWFLTGILLVLFGISYHASMVSMLRYCTAVFPIYIIFAKISEKEEVDNGLMLFLLLLQGFLMALWTIQSGIII